ncbi:hypothetical protein DFQ27_006759 [Actinomortierella ambigua]|uniref:Threonylcarbamoyl-AMP synthase n=1 Tax=Actinomortierella ambigua TaxID=1343610 RepID=A0A9P6PX67_9FUNG|nr:hypothetical protein DFQ27_006759 [Actinomortierella ambigua]
MPTAPSATAFKTILETIDPASIRYPTSDLEDPIPEILNDHTRQVLDQAAALLTAGQVVGMPTETVYGLAANALDSVAARKIFEAKNRPQDNPLIVHVSSLRMLRSILKNNEIPAVYEHLIAQYWPGPLTLLFPRAVALIPDEITCGQPTVAVRFPAHPIARALISHCDRPLAAPSANSSGKPSPTLAMHVMDDLTGKIPMVIDGGQCSFGIESTVVDGLRVPPAILRPGGVTYEQIQRVKNMEQVQVYKKHFTDLAMEQAPTTPGMKYRHYSPDAEVILVEYIEPTATIPGNTSTTTTTTTAATTSTGTTRATTTSDVPAQYRVILEQIEEMKRAGKMRFGILRTSITRAQGTAAQAELSSRSSLPTPPFTATTTATAAPVETSSTSTTTNVTSSAPTPSLSEPAVIEFPLGVGSQPDDVARELFKGLRYLDTQNVECIFVEGIKDQDTGLAVMNRVRKAASRTIFASS